MQARNSYDKGWTTRKVNVDFVPESETGLETQAAKNLYYQYHVSLKWCRENEPGLDHIVTGTNKTLAQVVEGDAQSHMRMCGIVTKKFGGGTSGTIVWYQVEEDNFMTPQLSI